MSQLYYDTRDALLTGPDAYVHDQYIRVTGTYKIMHSVDVLEEVIIEAPSVELLSHLAAFIRDAYKGEDVQLRSAMIAELIARTYSGMHDESDTDESDLRRVSEERRSEWKGAL